MDSLSRRTLFLIATVGLAITLMSLAFGRGDITFGVLGGVGIALFDFWLIQRFVNNLLAGHQRGFFLSGYLIRFAPLGGALYVFVRILDLNVLAVAAGFSALVVATILSGILGLDGTDRNVPARPDDDNVDWENSDG